MGLKFHKMTGTGNDFIFIDNFDKSIDLDPAELARKLCPRGTSVGADGLAFLEPDDKYDFQWRFHNADGSAAEMCGNGSRCAAWLMNRLGHTGTEVKFRTLAGVIGATVKDDHVRVEMTRPLNIQPRFQLDLDDGRSLDCGFIVTGPPHATVFVDDVEAIDIKELGPKIRRHPRFGQAGANANFVSPAGDGSWNIRTFERGVEGETLACGTGCVASALLLGLRGMASSPTKLNVRSGEELIIHYQTNETLTDPWPTPVYMEGPTLLVYEAELSEGVLDD